MNEDVISAESSTASDSSADTSQATVQPAQTQQQTQDQLPFHTHPRFKELTSSNRDLKGTVAQLQRTISDLQRAQMQSRSGDGMNDDERRQYGEAAAALRKVLSADPELARLLEISKQFPQVAQGVQGIEQLQQAAAKQHNQAARSYIRDLATAAKLATDDASLKHVSRLVAGAAMELENGQQRYGEGDFGVLDEAFKAVLPFLDGLRKGASTATAQTKDKVRSLPPAPRGGAAGDAAPAKLVPGKEREYETSLHQTATRMLKGIVGG